jgi:hypothetical protein
LLAQREERLMAAAPLVHEGADVPVACFCGFVREHVEIMREEDVHGIDAEPLERILERAHHTVIAVVIDLAARRRIVELADARALLGARQLEPASDLRRQHIILLRLAAQEMIEPRLRKPEPVERCRVEITDARLPGGGERRLRRLFAERAVEIADGRRAEAKLGEADNGAGRRGEIPGSHCPVRLPGQRS